MAKTPPKVHPYEGKYFIELWTVVNGRELRARKPFEVYPDRPARETQKVVELTAAHLLHSLMQGVAEADNPYR